MRCSDVLVLVCLLYFEQSPIPSHKSALLGPIVIDTHDHLVLSGRNIEVAKLERDVFKLCIVAINATGLPLLLIEYSYEFSILFIMVYTKQIYNDTLVLVVLLNGHILCV